MQWLIDIIIAAVLPPGMIMLWHGAIVDIPVGWHLCDGNDGTPDLRDIFVRGAGLSFAPGDRAGSHSHTHDYTGDGHSHTVVGGDEIAAGADYEALTSLSVGAGTTDSTSNIPPHEALAYIMKL